MSQPGSKGALSLPHGPSEIEGMYASSLTSRCTSWCTVSLVTLIYVAESFVYHWHLRPQLLAAATFNLLWALALWSYLQTCLTDPGTPGSPEWQAWRELRGAEQQLKEAEKGSEARREWRLGPSWCQSCGGERPQRAHHCTSCGCCVLRMDHHCPWVGSCLLARFSYVKGLF